MDRPGRPGPGPRAASGVGAAALLLGAAALLLGAAALLAAAVDGAGAREQTPGPTGSPATPVPCRDGAPDGARCHRVRVPEDRARPGGRELSLYVLVLPATGPADPSRALFFLAGGPGSAGSRSAEGLSDLLGPVRRDRDLVFLDFRGTGRSHALACPRPGSLQEYFDALWTRDRVARCWERVTEEADPDHFGNPEIADDVEAVREALGYGPIDLYGISGGSRVAQTVIRRHGGAVRAVVLEGVVPMDQRVPLEYARHFQRSLDLLISECAAVPECAGAYPELGADVEALFRRLGEEPVRVEVDPEDRARGLVSYDARDLAYTLRGLLYGEDAREIPRLVRRALEGDPGPLAQRYLERWEGLEGRLALGSHFSVFCSEDLAELPPEPPEGHGKGSLLGSYAAAEYLKACAEWPVEPAPAGFRTPVRSDVPALLISGGIDPVTPPSYGERVAGNLARSTHVVFPRGGHGYDGGTNDCRRSLVRSFFQDPSAKPDAGCVGRIPPRGFELPGEG